MTKTTLETKLQKHEVTNSIKDSFFYRGDYHTIDGYDIQSVIDSIGDDEEFTDYTDLEDKLDYNGRWSELADTQCPIYYNDIAKWFSENYIAIDEYVSEFGEMAEDGGGKPDIMKTIQCAFVVSYERDIKNAFKSFVEDNN